MTAAAGEQLATGPYKGLLPFEDTELDAVLFFGREREQEVISANLMASRLTVLYGASGVGKTSVLRAAVAHRLRRAARRNLADRGHPEHAVVILDRWSDDPLEGLLESVEASLAELFGNDAVRGVRGATLAGTLDDWTSGLDCDLLLILDQMEEYFLYHPPEAGSGSFAEELPELITRAGLRVNVLIAIREDAVAQLDRFKARIPNLFGNYLRLDHLDREAARAAIVGPLEQFNRLSGQDGVACEPELVEAVLDQTATGRLDLGEGGRGVAPVAREVERIEAPYLQLVMQRLWEEEGAAGSRTLRHETLERLGGAQEIVRGHLQRALEELRPDQRDVAANVFHHLVTPSGTKIAHRIADLAEYADVHEEELIPVLATLGRERIVRTVDGAGDGDGSRYEIFHDVLAEPVLVWRSERRLERERQEAERRHRRILVLAVAALIGLGAMAAVAVFALTQRSFALDQRGEAREAARHARAREFAARSASLLGSDPATSLRLALDAARLEPTVESEERLRTALLSANLRALYPGGGGPIVSAGVTPDERRVVTVAAAGWLRVFTRAGRMLTSRRAPGGVTAADLSTDGTLVATGGRDRVVRVWGVSGGSPILALRQARVVTSLTFSPDRRNLAVATGDRTVGIWRVPGGGLLRTFVLARVARQLVFSPDGRSLVTVGGETSARVYDVASGSLRFKLPHAGTVTRAVFSHNGHLIGTASMDKTARIWFADTGRLHEELRGHVGHVLDVAFGPRGTLVATTSTDATSRIWKAGSGEVIAPLFGHKNYVVDAEFSSTGDSIVTASLDRTARVYDAKKGKPQSALIGHRGAVTGAIFTSDGGRVLTWSEDGTARLWDPQTQDDLVVLGRYGAPVRRAVFSPDGRLVAVATDRGAFVIHSATGRVERRLLAGTPVDAVTFRPDGRVLALGSGRRVTIVRTGTWARLRTLGQAGPVSSIAFAPDGKRLATAGGDGIGRVWSLDRGLERELRGHGGPVTDIAFSPDGHRVATSSEDRTARIWSLETGKTLRVLRGHRDVVTSVAFSPDGARVVTASRDHKPRVWDVGTGRTIRRLIGHFGTVSDASFSPDGRWVLTAGPVTAGLWGAPADRPLLLHGPLEPMTSVSFDATGRRIVASSVEGTVRVYNCRLCGRLDELVALARTRLAPLEQAPAR